MDVKHLSVTGAQNPLMCGKARDPREMMKGLYVHGSMATPGQLTDRRMCPACVSAPGLPGWMSQ